MVITDDRTTSLVESYSSEDFIQLVKENKIQVEQVVAISMADFNLPLKIKIISLPTTASFPLVVCFHGLIERRKRSVPVFEGAYLRSELQDRALTISISDPLLERFSDLTTTWYTGSADFNTSDMIRTFVASMTAALVPCKTIFVGTSTGGHAALCQSSFVANSIAVVCNPITEISSYMKWHVGLFLKRCWPLVSDAKSLNSVVVDDVSELYKESSVNKVILLNNSSDHHFWGKTVPFLSKTAEQFSRGNNLLFISDFFDSHIGHSVPRDFLRLWVNAAVSVDELEIFSIAACAKKLQKDAQEYSTSAVTSAHEKVCNDRYLSDVAIANQIFSQATRESHE